MATVSSVAPAFGHISGNLKITITGTGFSAHPIVRLGTSRCIEVVVVNSTTITAVTRPIAAAAAVDVTVQEPDGTQATLASGFTYLANPVIIDADTSSGVVTSNSNAWTLTYPTNVRIGDVLVAMVGVDGAPTFTWNSPWAVIASLTNVAASVSAGYVRAASALSGTFTLNLGATEQGGWRIWRINGVYDDATLANFIASATASGTDANPNGPNLDPANWGTEATLWAVAIGVDTSRTVSTYPGNMADSQGSNVSGGAGGATVAVAAAAGVPASSRDPGTFTVSASDEWAAITLGIRPAVLPTFEKARLFPKRTFWTWNKRR